MKEILLLTHGGWGMSLLKGVSMILGKIEFVSEIPLEPQMSLSEYQIEIRSFLENHRETVLILTDLFGGTTTNAAIVVGREYSVRVVTGLNAPLLLEACSQLLFEDRIDTDEVLETGKESIMDAVEKVTDSLKQKGVCKDG